MSKIIPISLATFPPLGTMNMYLIVDEPLTLVDCGINTEEHYALLEEAINGQGATVSDIKRIIVTHTHPDHCGLTRRIQEQSRAIIYIHGREREKWSTGNSTSSHLFTWAGCDVPKSTPVPVPDLSPKNCRTLSDGDVLHCSDFNLRVLHTPGHCSGLVCLFDEKNGRIFSADQLTEKFSPALMVEADSSFQTGRTPSYRQNWASLDRLEKLNIQQVLPGHGAPFTEAQKAIDRQRASREKRLASLVNYVTTTPQTLYQICRTISPNYPISSYYFLLGNTLACLDELYLRKQIKIDQEKDVPQFYR